MRSSPKISFRFTNSEVSQKEKAKVNFFPGQADNGGVENFAKCTRVLVKEDLCSAEKPLMNMSSTIQHSSPISRHCNALEPSWEEDFIDLTEFCQPSAIPIKTVDEHVTSPISTVRNHGFNYLLEANDLDHNIDDNLWCIPSPMAMQEELCDPISDWLVATKEGNHNNNSINDSHHNHHHTTDNLPPRSEISYDINEMLLNSHQLLVPNNASPYHKKSSNFITSPPLQPEPTSFFHTKSSPVFSDSRDTALSENLMLTRPEISIRLPPANSLFADKHRDPAATYSLPTRQNQFLEMTATSPTLDAVLASTADAVATADASSSCTIQSPSMPQSNRSLEKKSSSVVIPVMPNTRLKLDIDESAPTMTSTCRTKLHTPEMLQPFVSKNADFDLVSYVFDDNKPSAIPLDASSLQTNTINVPSMRRDSLRKKANVDSTTTPIIKSQPAVTIKTEPKDESSVDEYSSSSKGYSSFSSCGKQGVDEDEEQYRAKRRRRSSTCSSEDLTQLESEKYRELRNKNNEASRRSRANRKTREVEMREHAYKLESENRRLKVKAEEMEKLVKRLRNCLMQLVLKRR